MYLFNTYQVNTLYILILTNLIIVSLPYTNKIGRLEIYNKQSGYGLKTSNLTTTLFSTTTLLVLCGKINFSYV